MARTRRSESDGSVRGKPAGTTKCRGCGTPFKPTMQEMVCRVCIDSIVAEVDAWLPVLGRSDWH